MSDISPRVELPYIQPSQAQKHVTHNEALQRLDAVTQLTVIAFDVETPPVTPESGDIHAMGASPTGTWATAQAGQLAVWSGLSWSFISPKEGWQAWGINDQVLRVWNGSAWENSITALNGLEMLGIATDADATNRLSVRSPATLFTHDGAGHQVKVNKATDADTASLLFQSNWLGHAEMGLAGDSAFTIKTSVDGTVWHENLQVDPVAQEISFAPTSAPKMRLSDTEMQLDVPLTGTAVQATPHDLIAGQVLTAGTLGLAPGTTSLPSDLDVANGTWVTGYNGKTTGPVSLTGDALDGSGVLFQAQRATDRRHQLFQTLTGQLFHRHETGGGWETAKKVFDTGNLVGTVSQSAGVPTGAVVEQGSNANGKYTRFADGTQIVSHRIPGPDLSI